MPLSLLRVGQVVVNTMVTVLLSWPATESVQSPGDAESILLVTTISLIDGIELSRLAWPLVAEPMPRPTPHWKDVSSIHFWWFVSVTSPVIEPLFHSM